MNGNDPVGDRGARVATSDALPQFHTGGAALGPGDAGRWGAPDDADDPPADDAGERARWAALPDGRRSRLRGLLRQVELAILPLRPAHAGALHDLDDSLRALAAALDLGPEPTVRTCPTCGHLGMVGATICGFCWTAALAQE